MGPVLVESRADEIDLLNILQSGRCRLLAKPRNVVANLAVERGVALRIFQVAAKQEILFGASRLQELDLEPVGLREDRFRAFRNLAIAILGGGADMIDGAEHQDAGDANRADRCDLVRQKNPQMNAEHVSPQKNCFRSCAEMHVKYRPC